MSKVSHMKFNSYLALVLTGILIESFFYFGQEHNLYSSTIVGAAILVLSLLLFDNSNKLLLFVFLTPNQRVITSIDSDFSLVNLIALCMVFSMLYYRKLRIPGAQLTLCFLLIIYSIFIAIFLGPTINVLVAIKASILFTALLSYLNNESNKLDFTSISSAYIFGTISAGLIGLFFGGIEFGQRFQAGISNNANILGTSLSFSLSCIPLLVTSGKWKPFFGLLTTVSVVFIGLLTQSRSFLLCLLVTLIFSVLYLLRAKRNRRIFLIFIAFISITTVLLSSFDVPYFRDSYESAIQRITNPRQDDISGGRINLWKAYSEYILSNNSVLLFGTDTETIMKDVGVDQVAHNAFLELVISWGLLGFLIILITLVNFTRECINIVSKRYYHAYSLLPFLPLSVLLISRITGHNILGIGFISELFIASLALFALSEYINNNLVRKRSAL